MSEDSTTHKRAIPLTPPGAHWSQREYVACISLGIGFAAHRHDDLRSAFHYGFPNDIGCVSVIVSPTGVERYIDHDFPRGLEWIEKCAAATKADEAKRHAR